MARGFWSALLVLLAMLAAFAAGRASRRPDAIPLPTPSVAHLRDSLAIARAADSLRLTGWADSVARSRGDSLASLARAYWSRHRPAARLVRDTIQLPGDTVAIPLPPLVVREMIVSDSACRDSLATCEGGRLLATVEAAEDSAALADHQATDARERWVWAARGAAFGAGIVAVAAAVLQ